MLFQRSPRIMIAVAIVVLTCGRASAQPADGELAPLPRSIANPWEEVPARFDLRGRVIDQEGRPVPAATVTVGDGEPVRTDEGGRFRLLQPVSPAAEVVVAGDGYVTRRLLAGDLYAGHEGETGDSVVRLPRFQTEVAVGPEGGTFRGPATLEIPAGALTREVVVRAAVLPLEMTWARRDDLQISRLAGLQLEPEGLRFARPIRVHLELPEDLVPAGPELSVLVLDRRSGDYVEAEQAAASVDGRRLTLTLSHFSRYVTGDPSQGVVRTLVRHTVDVNGDDETTAEDAEQVIILSGGPHGAAWSVTSTAGRTVLATTETASESALSRTTTAAAGVSFGGVGVSLEQSLTQEESELLLRRLGFSRSEEKEVAERRSLSVDEYDTRCLYLLRYYDYYRVEQWRSHEPNPGERQQLEQAWTGRPDPSSPWGYFIWPKTSIASERTLYGPIGVAVHHDGSRWRFYVRTATYLVREPAGTHDLRCNPGPVRGNPPGMWLGAGGPEKARFFAAGDGYLSVHYRGWGILPTTRPIPHRQLECGSDLEKRVTIRTGLEETSEEERSRTVAESSETELSASLDLPLPGGLGLSGSAAYNQARSLATTVARSYGTRLSGQVERTIEYSIRNEHPHHLSDHELYRLHLMHTVRSWRPLSNDEVPGELRRIPSFQWRWTAGRAFARTGGGLVMRTDDGRWFASGPPVSHKKECGLLLLRTAENPCAQDESGRGQGETPGAPPPVPTPPGDRGRQDRRPPVFTSGRGEDRKPPSLPAGTSLVPPQNLHQGYWAFGTVVDPQGEPVTGATVQVAEGHTTTDEEGRFWIPPEIAAGDAVRLDLLGVDRAGGGPGPPATTSADLRVLPPEGTTGSPEVDSVPRFVAWEPFHVSGRGLACTPRSEIEARLGAFTARVLACNGGTRWTVKPPARTGEANGPRLGEVDFAVAVDGVASPPRHLLRIALDMALEPPTIARGTSGHLKVRVLGTSDPVPLLVTNWSPKVVRFTAGESVVISTSGGADNRATLAYRGRRRGNYVINVRIVDEREGER